MYALLLLFQVSQWLANLIYILFKTLSKSLKLQYRGLLDFFIQEMNKTSLLFKDKLEN